MTQDEIDKFAECLWQAIPGKKVAEHWLEVPKESRKVWQNSFQVFVDAVEKAGYGIVKVNKGPGR